MSTQLTFREHLVPDGQYNATITSVEETETTTGRALSVKFRIREPGQECDGALVSTLVDMHLARGTRLASMYEAATGEALATGETFELKDMEGKAVRAQVENLPSKSGEVYSRVVAVLPPLERRG